MGAETDGNYGNLACRDIDWSAFTHLIMFALAAKQNGSIAYNNLVTSRRKPFNDIAHARGKPILVSVGGAGNTSFTSALTGAYRMNFVNSLLSVLDNDHYDGIDIDDESAVRSSNTKNYSSFIRQLWDSLQTRHAYYDTTKKPLLTAAMIPSWGGKIFVELEDKFDQINIMTYDMGGTWFGKTWHNNAVFSRTDGDVNDADKDVHGEEMTTIQKRVEQQIKYGGNQARYGIGIDLYGYYWIGGAVEGTNMQQGVTAPRQRWVKSYPPEVKPNIPFHRIQAEYLDTISAQNYRWDSTAQAPYLSIDKHDRLQDVFVSFTDTVAVKQIVRYAKDNALGGIFIWEFGGGYLPPQYSDRHRLLKATKQALDSKN